MGFAEVGDSFLFRLDAVVILPVFGWWDVDGSHRVFQQEMD